MFFLTKELNLKILQIGAVSTRAESNVKKNYNFYWVINMTEYQQNMNQKFSIMEGIFHNMKFGMETEVHTLI